MTTTGCGQERDLIIGITPFGSPNPRLTAALSRAGALGVLDLGRDAARARAALAQASRWTKEPWGVRVPAGCTLEPHELPAGVTTIILPHGSPWVLRQAQDDTPSRRVLVEVEDLEGAQRALAGGAAGLIARGSEGGGHVGELTTFVLLQHLLADPQIDVPVWAAGGIGRHSAAAAIAGGAAGVVLDAQLALVREAALPKEIATAIGAMDGSETTLIGSHRVYTRPDLAARRAHWPELIGGELSEGAVAQRLGADGFDEQLLAVGQDGAFARGLAEEFTTAGALVQGMRASIAAHLADAAAVQPLRADSAFARTRGVRYPVAQGPMTRVSDRAAFAAHVAEHGGLPFLALALMEGEDVRRLLAETAKLLGDRPWGVGILGFAPAQVREAQLAAIQQFRPPCALIAGGRPSQAAPLEAAGIDTFMHVPSPGLLERFLHEGARKFVFEGRECGGHVGPRASFALWDAQVEALLRFGESTSAPKSFFSELHVLFAGGIHDERSAAMAAALAAPLAARGAGVGVLMGTAYLFTEEAVRTQAIVPTFQEAAVACRETVLLETSPGHATRCARTPFADAFEATKARLAGDGIPAQTMWAELEQLNLGRLRLAAKGVRRSGEMLVTVDEDEQRAEGMVMIGQVAALRDATTTIAALHEQVTAGASAFLDVAARAYRAPAPARAAMPLDVAIVGMACIFPKAPDLEQYWANILHGVDAITDVPSERWDPAVHWDPHATGAHAGRRTPSKWGGFIPAIPFDPMTYGIPPSSLIGIEPVQLLALHVAERALHDAGYARRNPHRERTSVVFGAEAGSDLAAAYNFRATFRSYFGELPPDFDSELPELTEDSFPGGLSNVIAGRIANRLDLRGANFTVDAACASSLAALDLSCKELASGNSDMVLCGGADLHNTVEDYFLFSSVHALSPTGRPRPFDANSDGIALGEGVACVVLKRLADAERDGDRIYAVIRGIGSSSDGRSLGLTAPRPEGQQLALERAYERAGIAPQRVGLVEAHGTGTVVGDRTELAAISKMYSESGVAPQSCAIGSVKSQIGHTKCAAGVAGVIKTALALWTGVRPPTRALTQPNPVWQRETNPFFFTTNALPWTAAPEDRVAGVSGFGFGGTNFHAVLSAYDGAPDPAQAIDAWPAELFVFHGRDRADALGAIDGLQALIAANDGAARPWHLRDLARTLAAREAERPGNLPAQVALVADDLDDLAVKLAAARAFEARDGVFVRDEGTANGEVAFLFPGQGSQRPGMLADLFVAFPALRALLVEGARYAGTIFPPTAFTPEEKARQQAALTDTRVAQPALGIAGLAVHDLLASFGVRPAMAGGHSYGELVALCAAGVIDRADLLAMSAARAEAIMGAAGDDPGAMAAVTATAETTREALGPASGVVIANDNAPLQVVISGPTPAIEAAVERLTSRGISAKRIPVACGFHSPVVARAATTFGAHLAAVAFGEPRLPVWSNTTASRYPANDAERARRLLAEQVAQPVCFVEQIESMYAAGARIFVETGPGRVLTQLVDKILADRPHVAIPCEVSGEPGLRRLMLALAALAVNGVPVDVAALFAERRARIVAVQDAPRRPGWLVDGFTIRTADGAYLPGGLRPMRQRALPAAAAAPAASAAPLVAAATAAPAADALEATVLEFLRTSRELIASQREVVLGLLGRDPARAVHAPAPVAATNGTAHRHAFVAEPIAAPVALVAAPAAAATPAAAGREPADVLQAVVGIVSERTGYPPEMLDRDLDLEADLSIDSIKRTEIFAALAERVGLTAPGTSLDERTLAELSARKTLQAIVAWIVERVAPATVPAAVPARVAAAPQQPQRTPETILAGVVAVVSERTGYPPEMLDRDLDLEADLSIDSIKRTEIFAALADRLELTAPGTGLDETALNQLSARKTLGAIVAWIIERSSPTPLAVTPTAAAVAAAPTPLRSGPPLRRLRVAPRAIDSPYAVTPPDRLRKNRIVLVADAHGIASALAALLRERGADVVEITVGDDPGSAIDGLIYLATADRERAPVLPGAFAAVRAALAAGANRLLVATANGGRFGFGEPNADATEELLHADAGWRGLVRTVARERPDVLARAVDLDPRREPAEHAHRLLQELLDDEGPAVTGWQGETRYTLDVEAAELHVADGARPKIPHLNEQSVVLLTGGARGITAQIASTLAHDTGCHVVLVGRTPPPTVAEAPDTASASDRIALRRALVARGLRVPAEIDALSAQILAERELRATLGHLERFAASVSYEVADVRDAAAVRAIVDRVTSKRGRLDLVVHGAGTLEDRLIAEKSDESFARVWSTKVDGALALVAALPATTRDVVFFGSIAGVFGNRGQVDYAAANDALDMLALALNRRAGGTRAIALDWGPWAAAAGGMVSPELEAEYTRRGIATIEVADGVRAFVNELVHGTRADAQAVYACADAATLAGDTSAGAPHALRAVGV